MVTHDVYIPQIDWQVHVYYAVTGYHAPPILADLLEIDCPPKLMKRIAKNLRSGKMDTGFTYSNKHLRCTVMVVGMHSSPAQFLNSLEHELRHLVDDISDAMKIPVRGEAVAYLTGDINSHIAEDVKMFLCDCHGCKTELGTKLSRNRPAKLLPIKHKHRTFES